MPTRPTKDGRIYDNCTITAPDGTPLCRTNLKKLWWYLERGLADPVVIRLNFEPKGMKNADDPYYLADKDNKCVVCGDQDGLNLHHVVPRCYRKHFPDAIKNHSSHDVVAICVACHTEYETHASRLKEQIGREFEYPLGYCPIDLEKRRIRKMARAIRDHGDVIPDPKKETIFQALQTYLGKHPTQSDLDELVNLDPGIDAVSHGEVVVANVDIQDFVERWRKHFISTMEPKYLPEGWDPFRKDF